MKQPAVNLMKGKYIILMLKYLQKKRTNYTVQFFPKQKCAALKNWNARFSANEDKKD